MKKRRCLAIITARGGSKRVKGKNLLEINGKPLLWYTIEIAKKCSVIHEVYINSEDQQILNYADQCGAKTYRRPSHLAKDTSKVLEVLQEQIVSMELEADTLLCIMLPTCPLRNMEDMKKSFQIFEKNSFQVPVVSVTQYEKAPEQALIINNDGKLVPKFGNDYTSRSQDHKSAFRYNTAIIFTTAGLILKQNDIVGDGAIPYIMPLDRSIDIDYTDHVNLVESMLKFKE